jgi:CRP-like cAMP-binding protein
MREILEYCEALPEESVGADKVILAEGEKSGLIFILIEGDVEILKRDLSISCTPFWKKTLKQVWYAVSF